MGIRNLWAEHPSLDWVAVILASGLTLVAVLAADIPRSNGVVLAFLGSVVVIAATAFTAGTFVCTLTYQSTNYLMSGLRQDHSAAIRRNWTSILGSLVVAGIVAAFAILFASWAPRIAATIGILCGLVVLIRSLRALWWLGRTLFIEDAATELPERIGYDHDLLVRKH